MSRKRTSEPPGRSWTQTAPSCGTMAWRAIRRDIGRYVPDLGGCAQAVLPAQADVLRLAPGLEQDGQILHEPFVAVKVVDIFRRPLLDIRQLLLPLQKTALRLIPHGGHPGIDEKGRHPQEHRCAHHQQNSHRPPKFPPVYPIAEQSAMLSVQYPERGIHGEYRMGQVQIRPADRRVRS